MDFQSLIDSLSGTLGSTLPSLMGAFLILIVGWLVAVVIRAGIRKGLGLAGLNERIAASTDSEMNLEGGIAKGVFYVIMLLVLVAFFNALQLQQVSGTLQGLLDQIFAFLPKAIAGGVLLLVAWIIATLVRTLSTKALAATTLDDKLAAGADMTPMSQNLGNVLYGLIFLLFLPGILGALQMEGLLAPVQQMMDEALGMLPNLIGAGAIGAIGYFAARLLRDLVTNLLAAAGADQLGERAGLSGTTTLSGLIGLVVYIFVFVPALIAALNTLQIEAISAPATAMLGTFMAALPNVFAAAVILGVAWFVSGFVASLVTSLLGGMGFDQLPEKLGIGGAFEGGSQPAELAGKTIVFFVMLFAVAEAAARLGFGQVETLVSVLIAFGGQVLLGAAIIAAGFWLANLAHGAIQRVSGDAASGMAGLARVAILGLVVAMGLRAMGLADDIVNMAFGLTLGSVAVAVALSFGLGGREAAGRQMEHWLSRLRSE